ncbi:MAG: hypothetical protein ACXVB9_11995 [Bdellovibrionota bacterium]
MIHLLAALFFLSPLAAFGDETPLDCGSLPDPARLCVYYEATPTLKADPMVISARKTCETFYRSSVEALKVLCAYDKESKTFDATVMSDSSKVSGSANALGVSKETYEQAQDFWRGYRGKVKEKLVRLQTDFGQSERQLIELSRQGIRNLRQEVDCKKDGIPGATPGFLLAGLAVRSYKEQGKVRQNVVDALQYLYEDASASGTQTRTLGNTASMREKAHGAIPESTGQTQAEQLTDTTKLEGMKGEQQVLQNSRSLIGLAPRLWRRSGTLAIKALIDFQRYGEVDAAGMFDIGAHAVAYVVGVSVGTSLMLAVGIYIVEQGIRKEIDAQEQRKFEPYVKFAASHVKGAASATSEQVAKAYRPLKEKAPYCLPACSSPLDCASIQP